MSEVCLAVVVGSGVQTLQDAGRPGYLRFGLSESGPMDRRAHAAANALVGAGSGATAIEIGLGGGTYAARGGPVRLAVAGAAGAASVDGAPVGDHRSLLLPEGSRLRIAPPRAGLYAYLAVAGGFRVPPVMGSAALHLRAGIGGLNGRPLRAGDAIPVAGPAEAGEADRALDPLPLDGEAPVRVVLGPQADRFPAEAIAAFLAATYRVSPRVDRMGCQLEGPALAHGPGGFDIVSDGTAAGAIQVPGSGRPIVLLADRQTTGGYPKIATVVSADLGRIAQRPPGAAVRFAAVSVAQAVALARAEAALIAGLAGRLRPLADLAARLGEANVAGVAVDALTPPGIF